MHSPRPTQARTLNAADAWAQAKSNASTIRDIIATFKPKLRLPTKEWARGSFKKKHRLARTHQKIGERGITDAKDVASTW